MAGPRTPDTTTTTTTTTDTDTDTAGTASASVRRVYRLPEGLRAAIGERRTARGQTLAAFLEEAVRGELPGLLAALAEAGLVGGDDDDGPTRPARLPLTAGLLGELRTAGRRCGLPASRLLLVCLARAAARKRRRGTGASARSAAGAGARGARP